MQLSKLNTALLFIAALGFANAAPTLDETEVIQAANGTDYTVEEARGVGDDCGTAWEHSNFAGKRWALLETGNSRCSILTNSGNDKWSSLEVEDGYKCKFYRNLFCRKNIPFGEGGEVVRTGPWKGNVPSGWHDKISSYRCIKD